MPESGMTLDHLLRRLHERLSMHAGELARGLAAMLLLAGPREPARRAIPVHGMAAMRRMQHARRRADHRGWVD
jgi:hypothetical protein